METNGLQKDNLECSHKELIEKWQKEKGLRNLYVGRGFKWVKIAWSVICALVLIVLIVTNINTNVPTVNGVPIGKLIDEEPVLIGFAVYAMGMIVYKLLIKFRTVYTYNSFYKWASKNGFDFNEYVSYNIEKIKQSENDKEKAKIASGISDTAEIFAYNLDSSQRARVRFWDCVSAILSCIGSFVFLVFWMKFLEQIFIDLYNIANGEIDIVWSTILDNILLLIIPIIISIINFALVLLSASVEYKGKNKWMNNTMPDAYAFLETVSPDEDIDFDLESL